MFCSKHYGMRGNLLIMGGIFMNSIPICFLWSRPVDSVMEQNKTSTDMNLENRSVSKRLNRADISEEDTENEKLMNDINRQDHVILTKQANETDVKSDFNIENYSEYEGEKDTFCETESLTEKTPRPSLDIVIENKSKEQFGNSEEPATTLCQSIGQILKNRTFVIYLLGGVTSYPALGLIMVFVVDIFLDKEFTSEDAAFGQLLLSALNVLGRFMPGILLQLSCVSTLSVPMLASLISTTVFPCLVVARVKWLATLLCAFTGLSLGMFVSIYSVTTVKLVGQERLPNAMGLLFSANSLGNAIAGPVCGKNNIVGNINYISEIDSPT